MGQHRRAVSFPWRPWVADLKWPTTFVSKLSPMVRVYLRIVDQHQNGLFTTAKVISLTYSTRVKTPMPSGEARPLRSGLSTSEGVWRLPSVKKRRVGSLGAGRGRRVDVVVLQVVG